MPVCLFSKYLLVVSAVFLSGIVDKLVSSTTEMSAVSLVGMNVVRPCLVRCFIL